MTTHKDLKVFIIGIDGATFDLMGPWMAAGQLPTLARLMREGAHGPLRSCLPPHSAPAWTSFMTGKNPGKHGIFHFTEAIPQSYQFRYVNAATRRAPSLWRILGDHGLRVGVMNVPMTFPPEPVNGFLISGLDTPSEQSEFTHPASLKQDLRRAVPNYHLDARFLGHMRDDATRAAVLKEMQDIERSRVDAMLYLINQQPLDFGMVVFTSTDQVQHHFWKYLSDPTSPFHDAILQIYQNIDENVARLLDALPEETTVILMSDHGFGAMSERLFYLNRWLEQSRLLKLKPQKAGLKGLGLRIAKSAERWLRQHLPESAKRRLLGMFPQAQQRLATMTSLGAIDWSQTKAFASEMGATAASIYINTKGVFPQGTVDPRDYDKLCADITDALLSLRDPDTGETIIKGVLRRDEVYHGPCTSLAPDLLIAWWEDGACAVKPSFRGGDKSQIFDKRSTDDLGWSGNHRRDGILILVGQGIRRGTTISNASIMDIAPTVLYRMGLPIPDDMDGKVLLDAFEPEFASRPITTTTAINPNGHPERGYSEEEAEAMAEKLRGLGYLE